MSDAITSQPEAKKSWVQNFVERARGEINKAPPAAPAAYMRETGSTVGEYAEGGIVGSLLGATHAKWGLDTKGGPIDGWIAGASAIASVGLSGHFPAFAARVRQVGSKAFTILSFRKSYEVVKHEPLPGGGDAVQRIASPGTGPGIAGEDPIERVARRLG